jgi:hypothetical protein
MVLKPGATSPFYQLMSLYYFHYVARIIIVVGGKVYITDIGGGAVINFEVYNKPVSVRVTEECRRGNF